MPRNLRNYIECEYLHVMTQGVNKSYIFNEEKDIKYYIKIMYKNLKDYNIKIIAYCIMNNHTHMLLNATSQQDVSKYMHKLNTSYSKYYNDQYKRVGHVFRDRYKAEPILDERYLWTCIKYIYDNPVKAGICDKPEKYPWSNYKPIPQKVIDEYAFMDIEEDREKVRKDFINRYLMERNISILNLKDNKSDIKTLIEILNVRYKLSIRKIAEELNLAKNTVRKIKSEQ